MNDSDFINFLIRDETKELLRNYVHLFNLYNENPNAAIFAIKKNFLHYSYCGEINILTDFSFNNLRCDNFKMLMSAHLEKVIHIDYGLTFKSEQIKMIHDISSEIFDKQSRLFTNLPTISRPNNGSIGLYSNGAYFADNSWILWQISGLIYVSQTANFLNYKSFFGGNPELKVVILDLVQMQGLNRILSRDYERGKNAIIEKARNEGFL